MRHAIQCTCRKCSEKRKGLGAPEPPKPNPVAKAKTRIRDHALFAFNLTAEQSLEFDKYIDRVFQEEGITAVE